MGLALYLPLEAVLLYAARLLGIWASHAVGLAPVVSIGARHPLLRGQNRRGLPSMGEDSIDGLNFVLVVFRGGEAILSNLMGLVALLSCLMISRSRVAS